MLTLHSSLLTLTLTLAITSQVTGFPASTDVSRRIFESKEKVELGISSKENKIQDKLKNWFEEGLNSLKGLENVNIEKLIKIIEESKRSTSECLNVEKKANESV